MKDKFLEMGDYILKPLDDKSYFLIKYDGEGTSIEKKYLHDIIEAYFTGTLDEYFNKVM